MDDRAAAPHIVCLGDAAVDVFVSMDGSAVARSDAPGTVRISAGGSAANVAVWSARLGASAGFIGAVGDDYAGGFLRADLERESVTAHLLRLPAASASIAVLLDERGERTMIADRGAALLLSPEFIGAHMFPSGCRLHLPAYSLFDGPLAEAAMVAVHYCRRAEGAVGVDASSVGPLRVYGRDGFLNLLARVEPDLLFANDDEGAFLSESSDPEEGSLYLRRFAGTVVWKLGAAGALARGDLCVRASARNVPVVDTTGAGDAFAAAFTLAHARGVPLVGALDQANSLASDVVQHIGARPCLTLR
jgi:sugar/nucleoside kinase (ribokinase family)